MKTNVFKTGVSDHHKMISTIMKLHFARESPKTKYYRDYLKFDISYFNSELSRQLVQPFVLLKRMKTLKNRSSHQRCSVRKAFLEILQNSQQNTCTRDSITLFEKRLWHRCFRVNFAKFLRTPFLTEHFWETASGRIKWIQSVHRVFPNLLICLIYRQRLKRKF